MIACGSQSEKLAIRCVLLRGTAQVDFGLQLEAGSSSCALLEADKFETRRVIKAGRLLGWKRRRDIVCKRDKRSTQKASDKHSG